MTRRQRRLVLIGSGVSVLAVAVALMLNALRDSIVFFNSPSDLMEKHVRPGTHMRLGGLVKNRTVVRGNNLSVRFEITGGKNGIPVNYRGVLPDLFREGQGVVAEGALDTGGTFNADSILANTMKATCLKRSPTPSSDQDWKYDYGPQAVMPGWRSQQMSTIRGAQFVGGPTIKAGRGRRGR
jgi:cytochrome c-type biogenesis protein CcmE